VTDAALLSAVPMWFCDPPIIGFKLPDETNMRLDGKRVDKILVQLRGKDGEDPTLEFFGAVLARVPAVGTENA
jgi:hypothetical protein